MATLSEHIAARNDADLLQRLVAAAERAGIPNPQQWAEANRGAIVAHENTDGTSIVDAHAYAVATYKPTPRPGQNPAAVTDDQIIAAVQAVHDATA